MSSHIPCPSCGKQCRILQEHAGKRVACPICKSPFTIPPEPPPRTGSEQPARLPSYLDLAANSTEKKTAKSTFNTKPNEIPIAQNRELKRTKVSTILAFCMLGATLLFPIAIGTLIVTGMLRAANESAQEDANSLDIGGGSSIVFHPSGRVSSKSESMKEAQSAGTMIGIFLGSICCPSIPYVLLMLVLGTAWFAFRSAGN